MQNTNILPRSGNKKISRLTFLKRDFIKYRYIYFMLIPVVAYYILFHYVPLYGAQIAFKRFTPGRGILGSPWVGFENFIDFFKSVYFSRVIRNTLTINLSNLAFGFPAPIILALLLNELRGKLFKRVVQTASYLPHFISVMVISGIIIDFTASDGLINDLIAAFGGERSSLLLNPKMFVPIFVGSGIWQELGWGSIIYLAAISGIDQELYEAAAIDGAGRFRQTLSVTLPGIMPTIIILLILRVGQIMNVGFEKIILLYNPSIYETADVISSFTYRMGLLNFEYSYAAAVGLFNSVINFTLILLANRISGKLSETSLW